MPSSEDEQIAESVWYGNCHDNDNNNSDNDNDNDNSDNDNDNDNNNIDNDNNNNSLIHSKRRTHGDYESKASVMHLTRIIGTTMFSF